MQMTFAPNYPSFPSFPPQAMMPPAMMPQAPMPNMPMMGEQFMASPALQMQLMMEELQAMMAGLMSGSNPAAPTSFSAPAASPVAFPTRREMTAASIGSNMPGSTDFGQRLAKTAEATANRINAPGLCLKGVNDSMQAMGLKVHRRPSAYMALEDLRKDPHFQEVQVPKSKLDSLPAGAIVVWGQGKGLPHGHISVALGDGREASSKVRKQLHLNSEFHVFMPK